MLQILNANDIVSAQELAFRLETNRRNIFEFKKELETAGYYIETVKGRYGGYRLKGKVQLAIIPLDEKEELAFNEAYAYLKNHRDFLMINEYTKAYEKIKASLSFSTMKSEVYFHALNSKVDPLILDMIAICEQAKKNCQTISFEYRSLRANQFHEVKICPYEILNIQGDYYVLGYNHQKHDFRFYKFSSVRMKNMTLTNQRFTRDLDFDLQMYLGKSGLMKDECIEVEFIITGKSAILYSEKNIGVSDQTYFDELNQLHVKTIFEGKMRAIHFLCSLGSEVKLLSPKFLIEEMKKEILKMSENYL